MKAIGTDEELTKTIAEMRRLNENQTVLALMPRMSQVWAKNQRSANAFA